MRYTQRECDLIRQLWSDHTAAELVNMINEKRPVEFWVTRNSVISRANRLNLVKKKRSGPKGRIVVQTVKRKTIQVIIAVIDKTLNWFINNFYLDMPYSIAKEIPFIDLESNQCKWPLYYARTADYQMCWFCCGKTVQYGKPYCVEHEILGRRKK